MNLVEDARTLAATLAEHTAAHERERRLAPSVVGRLRDGGFLHALLPHELGGHELAPTTYVEVLEALATGDAATAWCVMTASTSTLLAAYLDPAIAHAIWNPSHAPFLAGVFAPSGRATISGDTVTLTGRWSYGSGSHHADWFALGALVHGPAVGGAGTAVGGAGTAVGSVPSVTGAARHVVCFVRAGTAGIETEENWDTLGLGGTGSHDVVAEAVQLPVTQTASVFESVPWPVGTLYRLPLFGLLALGIASCGLGIARSALTHVGERLATPPAAGRATEPAAVLARWAELHAILGAARAYLLDVAMRAAVLPAHGVVNPAMRGELRLAAAYVAARCAEVTRGAFHLGGGPAMRAGHPLGRALRDLETLLTHRMVADRVLPASARAMLGVGPVPPDL